MACGGLEKAVRRRAKIQRFSILCGQFQPIRSIIFVKLGTWKTWVLTRRVMSVASFFRDPLKSQPMRIIHLQSSYRGMH